MLKAAMRQGCGDKVADLLKSGLAWCSPGQIEKRSKIAKGQGG